MFALTTRRTSSLRTFLSTTALPIILLISLCLPTLADVCSGENASITGNSRFTLNGYADLFKGDGSGSLSVLNGSGETIIGAPVAPRYCTANEVGMLADYGYETWRDIARFATLLSLVACLALCLNFVKRHGVKGMKPVILAKGVGLLAGVPLLVHLIGTFVINNLGGTAGGL